MYVKYLHFKYENENNNKNNDNKVTLLELGLGCSMSYGPDCLKMLACHSTSISLNTTHDVCTIIETAS